MSAAAAIGNAVVAGIGARAARRFRRALHDPEAAQSAVLERVVTANVATAFGAEHGFSSIRTVADYRERVPVRTYDQLRPWLSAVAEGCHGILTAERVDWLEPSGGSSGPSKLLPFTRALREELAAATLPWLVDLYRTRPRLRRGRAYWAVSPPARQPATSRGGIPIGADSDVGYFPQHLRRFLAPTQAVPASVASTGGIDACRRATLEALLDADDLTLISVWSPSFLTLLTDALDEHWDALRRGRRLPARPPEDLGEIWPRLHVISCWTGGHAARALAGVRRRFPNVTVQGKGLLATEGVVTIPLHAAAAPVAAVGSHFLEFLAGGTSSLLHELDAGATYEVVLSTGGGLYRYRLGDLVRVEGRLHATPMLAFVGRADGRVDLAGEKLSPAFVESALAAAQARSGVASSFALLAPRADHRGYVLSVEPVPAPATAGVKRLADALETELCAAYHYRLARDLGQLDPVAARAVRGADRLWEAACLARGQRAGAVKPPVLAAHPFEPELACQPLQ